MWNITIIIIIILLHFAPPKFRESQAPYHSHLGYSHKYVRTRSNVMEGTKAILTKALLRVDIVSEIGQTTWSGLKK